MRKTRRYHRRTWKIPSEQWWGWSAGRAEALDSACSSKRRKHRAGESRKGRGGASGVLPSRRGFLALVGKCRCAVGGRFRGLTRAVGAMSALLFALRLTCCSYWLVCLIGVLIRPTRGLADLQEQPIPPNRQQNLHRDDLGPSASSLANVDLDVYDDYEDLDDDLLEVNVTAGRAIEFTETDHEFVIVASVFPKCLLIQNLHFYRSLNTVAILKIRCRSLIFSRSTKSAV